jgi:glycosyltransferase involved in cell wall biosynthesis
MLGWELPPNICGGMGVACYQLCKALAKKDVDIEFVMPFKSTKPIGFMKVSSTKIKENSSEEYFVPDFGVYDSRLFSMLSLSSRETMEAFEDAVVKLVQNNKFDVIHAHDWLTCRAAVAAKKVSNLPLIVHVHSVESDRAGGNHGNEMVREIEAMGLMLADHIIAVSERTKQAIAKDYAIPLDKITVVHNSVDLENFEPLDEDNAYRYLSAMRSKGCKVVTYVGRLTIQKGLTNLLHVAKEVVNKSPKTLFLIVGDGDQRNELIRLAADLGIARNVIFTGFQRGKAWRDAFASGNLFVMPSVSEPFGLTPLEAINYGTPSLISRQSGVSEVFKNCLKVDFWDNKEMANQIAAALENTSILNTLRANAIQELSNLNWDGAAEKTINLYRNQLAGAMV